MLPLKSGELAMAIRNLSVSDLVKELNVLDETDQLEAKFISGDRLGKSVFETICAMSNEPDLGGGTILLGVKKEENTLFPYYAVIGIDNIDKISNDISSGCATMFNRPVRVQIDQEIVDGRPVIRIDVPEISTANKPVYFANSHLPMGAFRRIGAADQRCNDDDLIAFFQSRATDPFDNCIIEDASIEDIDEASIQNYRKARADVNPLAEELNWSDVDVLHALGAIKRLGSDVNVTATGLFVFGRNAALRRLRPTVRVDYVRVPGKEWVANIDHRFDSVDMRGPLTTLIGRVITTVLDDLPKAFKLEEGSAQRTDTPLIPQRVIREAVVNALMHRSYQNHQPVQIIRYSNRLEIRNPGYSLKSQERFGDPGSAIRNPHIAEILHETRFSETKGSGIRVMRERMTEMGLIEPTFISNRDADEFVAIFLFHHFLNESDWKWLSSFKGYNLSEDQMRALIFVREMGAIDNQSFRNVVDIDTLTASSQLRKLKELKLLTSRGSGSRTHYVAGPEYIELTRALHPKALSDDENQHATMHGNRETYDKEGIQRQALFAELSVEIRFDLMMQGKRADPNEIEVLILRLCRERPFSADEIAILLRKTKSYVSNRFLYKMVREGRLRYQFPGMVKHPSQRYTAAE